jgi:hypothetical protein
MNSDDLKARAQALRAAGNTPKQIARTLGIPRVTGRVPAAQQSVAAHRATRTPIPDKRLIGCWISRQWSNG